MHEHAHTTHDSDCISFFAYNRAFFSIAFYLRTRHTIDIGRSLVWKKSFYFSFGFFFARDTSRFDSYFYFFMVVFWLVVDFYCPVPFYSSKFSDKRVMMLLTVAWKMFQRLCRGFTFEHKFTNTRSFIKISSWWNR